MKLKRVQPASLLRMMNLLLGSIHKNTHLGEAGRHCLTNVACRFHIDESFTSLKKHESKSVNAAVNSELCVFQTGDSTNFNARSHWLQR